MIVLKTVQARVLGALQRVVGVVERRHTLPILANVLVRKTGPMIELTTTDLELQLRTCAELGGDSGDFATTVAARKLTDILRAMPADERVTLTASRSRLALQGAMSRYTLQTLPAEDFPLVQDAAGFGPALTVPQGLLKGLIDQVEFAMAVHDIRYFLNGVLLVADGKTLTLVATDGNRLALAQAEVRIDGPRQEVILPRKTVHELQRLLRDDAGQGDDDGQRDLLVEMRFAATQARFGFSGIEMVSKLIEGRFPDYKRVIPNDNRKVVTLVRAPFLASLQRASILTSEKFRGVRVNVAPGALSIVSSNAAQEEANEDLAVDYGGDSVEIGFNVTYLVDVLSKTSVETVRMAMHDASSSVLFTFPERTGFKYVVSPMRL